MPKRKFLLRVFPETGDISRAAAASLAALALARVKKFGHFSVVLSGGSTPRQLYTLLAAPPLAKAIPWERTFIYFGDERRVPHDHPDSNYAMAREALLDRVPIPPARIFPIPTDRPDAARCADAYEQLLRARFPGADFPAFDLMLLGVGADGHTASLFPGTPAAAERRRWVTWSDPAASSPAVKPAVARITLTVPVLWRAAHIFLLAAGKEKAGVLENVVSEEEPKQPPVARVLRECRNRVTLFLDAAAAQGVRGMFSPPE